MSKPSSCVEVVALGGNAPLNVTGGPFLPY